MGAMLRAYDWALTPLGRPETWPQSLRSALSICLGSSFPTAIYWGEELHLLYNDAWAPIPSERHPWALGRPAAEVWSDIWAVVGPQMLRVMQTGEGFSTFDQMLPMRRNNRVQETYWNYSFTPIRGEDGLVVGIFNQGHEVTDRVLGERRQTFLLHLSDRLRMLSDPQSIIELAQDSLGRHLNANRVGYGEVEETARYFTTERNWTDGVVPGREGTHDLASFGPEVLAALRAGRPLLIPDVEADPRLNSPEILAAFDAIDTRAAITASLVKDGRMRAALYVHARNPRPWTEQDAELVTEVADRTWSTVERARAELEVRAAELRLHESEARVRALTDNLPSGMVYQLATGADGSERRFLYVSQSHEKLTGVPAAAVMADPTLPYHLILPDDREALAAAEAAAIASERLFDEEVRFRRTDGEVRWCRIISAPRKQPDGSLIWDGIQIDITEQKAAEAELRELNANLEDRVADEIKRRGLAEEALRQSQKLEAMGQLTGGVAHDFNNLLTPIIGSLDMLVRRGASSEREQRLVAGALESAERAKTLVQRLLAFARRQPLQPVAVYLPSLIRNMAGLIGSTLGPGIDVRIDVADDVDPAHADANQLEMALLNLAVNARDAMPKGGSLTIAAQGQQVAESSHLALKPGRYVRLSVRDNGIGMDETTKDRAIEPFFSTKGIGRGTGLGLSMVHGLAAQLGGALDIQSRLGRGTTVELWLPTSTEHSEAGDETRTATKPARRGRALLVDDEVLVRMSTADMLADLGYEVEEAGSAEEALRLIEGSEPFDILITDHLMPGITGVELARMVRSQTPGMPILIVSGYSDVEGIAPDIPRLAKPFRNSELAARLAALTE